MEKRFTGIIHDKNPRAGARLEFRLCSGGVLHRQHVDLKNNLLRVCMFFQPSPDC